MEYELDDNDVSAAIEKIIDLNQSICQFWTRRVSGWATRDAAELLEASRMDRLVSLSHSLRLWMQPCPDEDREGHLILAWANLGILVEGTMTWFLCVWEGSYSQVPITCKQPIPPFAAERLEAISKVLGDTTEGLTGPEIGHLLSNCRIPDPNPDMTKWKRLYNAFVEFQVEHQVGNHVVVFIKRAMDPARYVDKPAVFRSRKDRLNTVLAFCGLELRDDGQLRRAAAATTIDQALERANRLHAALTQRSVHADVLAYCKAELLQDNYFHAVFEAMKSITAKIRSLSGLTGDGCDLVHDAFGQRYGDPLLAINPFKTETHKGEQNGFMNLLKGLYGTVRNPLAHDPKIEWDMTEQDALDILTMISLVHRKLDEAYRLRP